MFFALLILFQLASPTSDQDHDVYVDTCLQTRFSVALERFFTSHTKREYEAELRVLSELTHLNDNDKLLEMIDFRALCVECIHYIESLPGSHYSKQIVTSDLRTFMMRAEGKSNSELSQLKKDVLALMERIDKKSNNEEMASQILDHYVGPKDAAFYKYIGDFYRLLGNEDKAEENYIKATKEPDFASLADADHLYNSMANIHQSRGKKREAIACCLRATLMSPNNPTFHCNLGVMYRMNGNFKMAKKALQRALEIDPNYSLAKAELKRF